MEKTILLGSAIAVNLALAPISVYGTTPSAVSTTPTDLTGCIPIDDSSTDAWNTGEFCPDSGQGIPTAGSANMSAASSPPAAASARSIHSTPVSAINPVIASPARTECLSAGGANAAGPEGFCLASEIGTSLAKLANFAATNELAAKRLQFLQVTFKNGPTLSGSRLLPADDNTPLVAECSSAGGSTAFTAGGFCLSSDLTELAANMAKLSVANSLSAASLNFVQVTFGDREMLGEAGELSGSGTSTGPECTLVDGSRAVAGNPGGFCMASDLGSSTADLFANFTVANDLPVVGVQFLQIAFDQAHSQHFRRTVWPGGKKCESVDGSAATIGDADGACMVSDLATPSTDYSASFSVANSLAIAGMQYVQATFGRNQLPAGTARSTTVGAPTDGRCSSAQGSTAASTNAGGFCLVADRGRSALGFANFAIANDLPVASLRFLQVPFGDRATAKKLGAGKEGDPIGAVITDSSAFNRRLVPPSLVVSTGNLPFHFPAFDPTFAFRPYSNQDRKRNSFLSLSLGCEAEYADTPADQSLLGRLLNLGPAPCVRDRVRWGKLLLH
jgi:hypothetical protein